MNLPGNRLLKAIRPHPVPVHHRHQLHEHLSWQAWTKRRLAAITTTSCPRGSESVAVSALSLPLPIHDNLFDLTSLYLVLSGMALGWSDTNTEMSSSSQHGGDDGQHVTARTVSQWQPRSVPSNEDSQRERRPPKVRRSVALRATGRTRRSSDGRASLDVSVLSMLAN